MDEMINQISAEPTEPEQPEEKKEAAKPFSLRLGEDSVQAFRAWCEENNMSQADGFSNLLKMLELQKTKELIPNRQKEIDNFQALLTALATSFMSSLELNENAEMRIRQVLQRDLEIKDQALSDYQEQLKKEKEKNKVLQDKSVELDSLQDVLAEYKRINDFNLQQIQEQAEHISLLQKDLKAAEALSEEYRHGSELYDECVKDNLSWKKEVEEYQKELRRVRELNELDLQKTKIETEQKIKEEWMDKLQNERDKWSTEKDTLLDEIRKLERQLGDLKLEKEKLQNESAVRLEKITNNYNVLQSEYIAYKKTHPDVTAKQKGE